MISSATPQNHSYTRNCFGHFSPHPLNIYIYILTPQLKAHALMTSYACGVRCSHNLTVNYSVHAYFIRYSVRGAVEKRAAANTDVSSQVFSGVRTVRHAQVQEAARRDAHFECLCNLRARKKKKKKNEPRGTDRVLRERDGSTERKKKKREPERGRESGRVRGGIWEKKHRKNNRKGKLRDQA